MGLPPTQGDEKRLGPATTLYATVALSFVIPTGAQRSGGTCGSADPSWKRRLLSSSRIVISTGAKRSGEICGSHLSPTRLCRHQITTRAAQ
jgi:hypothetical protein